MNELCGQLQKNGFQAAGIHGDLRQNQRNQVMNDFKSGRIGILVATDVAARGIDVENVDAVFNYDIPEEDEYYIHRIGRTGRAGKSGTSYTLASGRVQLRRVLSLEKYMGLNIQEKSLPNTEEIRERHLNKFKGKIKQLLDENGGLEWTAFVDELERTGYDVKKVAAALCKIVYEKDGGHRILKNVQRGEPYSPETGKARLSINIGTDSKINADYIIGSIVETTGLPISAVGKIDLYKDHSVVETTADYAALIMKKMNGFRMRQRIIHITALKSKKSDSFPEATGKTHGSGHDRLNSKKRYNTGSAHKYHRGRSKSI